MHQAFLNAGGLGILIGDGQLPNPGLEKIFETYYSYALSPEMRVSFDYHTQYAVGDECACVGSLTNHFPNGATYRVEGVFAYRVHPDGKLASLRTYWEHEKGVFRPPPSGGKG